MDKKLTFDGVCLGYPEFTVFRYVILPWESLGLFKKLIKSLGFLLHLLSEAHVLWYEGTDWRLPHPGHQPQRSLFRLPPSVTS